MSETILIIEDDKNINEIIKFNLKKEGFECLQAFDGEEGFNTFNSNRCDLLLLDIMMPKLDGIQLCTEIRKISDIPIIMLTAKADEVDKVLGLEVGADDYITKPFSNNELIARIRANLRRRPKEEGTGDLLKIGDITIDRKKYIITKRNEEVNLSKREYEIVDFLATNKDKIFSREELLKEIWGYEYYGDLRTVDVSIRRLRAKIEDNSEAPIYILTKRGVGYHFGGLDV